MNCAGRELLEETGYLAGRLKPLGNFFSSPGIMSEKMYAYAAYDLQKKKSALEEGEEIEVFQASIDDAVGMIRDGAIVDFSTAMTGELFAVLRRHSILGAGAEEGGPDPDAFARGVVAARDSGSAGGLSRLFSARALMLDGALAPASVPDYLSGLLLGEELRAQLAGGRFRVDAPIQLIGDAALCARYREAAAHFDLAFAEPQVDVAADGLWQLAVAGGLVAPSLAAAPREARSC